MGNKALSRVENFVIAPIVGFVTVAAAMLAPWWVRPLHGLKDRRSAATFAVATGLCNYGYVPILLAALFLPGDGTTGVLFVHNVGVEAALLTVGVLFRARGLGICVSSLTAH